MLDKEPRPLLSICIPTYNRSELLRSALFSVVPQVREFEGDVEIIVSDNCSTDATSEVVEWARQFGPIRYNRNRENIGLVPNVVFVAEQLAQGEFSWILGDDDFVRDGAIAKILGVIKQYSDIDYIFTSLCHISTEQLKDYPSPVSSRDLPDDLQLDNKNGESYYVNRWEELIDPEVSETFLGSIQTSVFRTQLWREHAKDLVIGDLFTSLEASYPQICIFARSMVGRKAYHVGDPLVIVVSGAREWIDLASILIVVRLNEALDLYESVGVPQAIIKRCRTFQYRRAGSYFAGMLFNHNREDIQKIISYREVFKTYYQHWSFWRNFIPSVISELIRLCLRKY